MVIGSWIIMLNPVNIYMYGFLMIDILNIIIVENNLDYHII